MSASLPVLIAGATGSVGAEAVRLCKQRGMRVTALARGARTLEGVADRVMPFDATEGVPELAGHRVVLSTLGASVAMSHRDRRGFRKIDFGANMNLLKACKRAGVKRFVYVAAHVEPGYADTTYIEAHEEFVAALRAEQGIASTIVRPTGIFSAFHDFIPMAARGLMMVLGDGKARTNPIHQADVAAACVEFLDQGPAEISVGGPDVVTRREIAEMAFQALGKKPRILHMPGGVMRFGGTMTKLINPRLGEMLEFVSRVAVVDSIAPVKGARRLEDYLRELANPQ